MKEADALSRWCPMSRVVLQREVTNGKIETVGPAYNRTSMNYTPLLDANLARSAMCIGSGCAWWETSWINYIPILGYFYPRSGKCGILK